MDTYNIEINKNTSFIFSNDLHGRFIRYLDVSPKTLYTYSKAIKQFLKWMSVNNIINPVREHVLSYKKDIENTCKPATVQNYIISLRQFFKWTESEGLYPNISNGIKGAKISKNYKNDALTTFQVKNILNSMETKTLKGKRNYALFALMVTSGLRTIEITRSNIEDIRTVADQIVLFIQGKGETEKNEYVKLPFPVEKAISQYLTARGKANYNDPLFSGLSNRKKNSRMTTRSISRLIKDCFIKAGYNNDRLTAHSLRHTTATLNLLNGGTLEETQQLLRHSQINTTMIYLHHMSRISNNSEIRIAEAIF